MRVLLISLALAGAFATDQIASTTKDYITSRIAAGCPANLAPSAATDVRALAGSNRYEITFDDVATFHVRLDAAGAVAKCVPESSSAALLKRKSPPLTMRFAHCAHTNAPPARRRSAAHCVLGR